MLRNNRSISGSSRSGFEQPYVLNRSVEHCGCVKLRMAPAEVSQNRYVKFSTWSQMVEIIYFLVNFSSGRLDFS